MARLPVHAALALILIAIAATASIPAQATIQSPLQLTDQSANIAGLVGHWSLDERSGGIAHNVFSGGDDGAVHNAAWTDGISGGALHFDGDSDYVEIASSSDLTLTGTMTLAAWVRPDTVCQWNNPIIQMDGSYGLKLTSGAQAVGFVWTGRESHASATQLDPGVWYHLAATFEHGVHRIYVNGVLENQETDPIEAIPGSASPLTIGRGMYGCDFAGTIDEVYLFRTALTTQEIHSIQQTATIPEAPGNLRAESATQGSIRLSWSDSSLDEQGFRIYRADQSAQSAVLLATVGADTVTFTDTALQCGQDYFYEVSAYNQAGESARSARVMGTPAQCSSSHAVYLANVAVPEVITPVASVLTPFDANVDDVVGPTSWDGSYGKSPEIIVASDGSELDVLAQDYDPATAWKAVLLHIKPLSVGYRVTQALTNIPSLDRVMGLAIDGSGNRYYATGVDESALVSPTYPPLNTYRSNIVRVIKLNRAGAVQLNIDLDTARHAFDSSAEMIINPMEAATSRLAVGGNEIALVHGINTAPDWNIGGTRHQKALSTRLDATSGAVTRTSSAWVSHSFDQRLLFDGEAIVEHHLGDAYPRSLVFARGDTSAPLFQIKGALGENNTYTRLGNLALIEQDPAYRYLALFATESSATEGGQINGPRNLAIVRVKGDDYSVDPSLPDTLTVISEGTPYTNRLRWLTRYSAASSLHAERPKLIGIGNNRYIVLWEEWRTTGSYSDTFNGVYGMVIDDKGNIVRDARLITSRHHLHRGDDAFFLDQRAAWVTGSAAERKLYIHFVDASLNYQMMTVE